MKFSEQWLREWVNPAITSDDLVSQLTLAGLEVDSALPVAPPFSNIVVGEVIEVKQHPDADRLRVCQVNVGDVVLSIVCGAQNVRANLRVPVAKIDAVLPGDFKIKKSKLRGVDSYGMICSESELGLAETSAGIMELPQDAPIGEDIRQYLKLDDVVIDIELTPNRGDCLSILGIAREVAAINDMTLSDTGANTSAVTISDSVKVINEASEACPHYVGRVIRNIPKTQSPTWLKEKLRRSGLRAISPVVDATNYILLELGQPLHAFNLNHVDEQIIVRFAHDNEMINLLDDQQIKLTREDLIIANDKGPLALAGIKGGSESGITPEVTDIFLESALFAPNVIARATQKHGIYTDSSHRFERNVDSKLQKLAIEKVSALIQSIAGGDLGPIIECGHEAVPRSPIELRTARVAKILGIEIPPKKIEAILKRLNMQLAMTDTGWDVMPPSYRSDIAAEIDLIEEIARLHGYENIEGTKIEAHLAFIPANETQLPLSRFKDVLVDCGYQEAITYSFVDPVYEQRLKLQDAPLQLLNPISSELSTMRSNHWPGLIQAYQYNYSRQQSRIRLFETGLCFQNDPGELKQILRLGGLVSGFLHPEQWGETKRAADFYDVKSDLEKILKLTGQDYQFQAMGHPALHPGKSAGILVNNAIIGYLGALHPTIAQKFDINQPLYLFDLNLESIMFSLLPTYEAISKFPAIRRDIALVVATNVPAGIIQEKILDSGGDLLKNVQIFDVYQGKGIEPGKKSIALSLIFQHVTRTLVDSEINDFMQKLITSLHKEFNATLRD